MKRNLIHAAIITALSLFLLPGCKKESKAVIPADENGKPVRFSTIIKTTRAYNNMWEEGDRIGVYMLPAAGADVLTAGETPATPLAANKLYAHETGEESESVIFEGVDEENTIFWPNDGSTVDFVAYYPWRPSGVITGDIYPMELTDQSVQRNIDLMYSSNVTGVQTGNPALKFEHKLAAVLFNVVDVDGIALEGMRTTIEGLPASAGFDLRTGEMVASAEAEAAPFDALLVSTSDADEDGTHESAIVTAIVLPGADLDYSVKFVLQSGDEAVFPLDAVEYVAGKRYIYDITLSSAPGEEVGFGGGGELSTITDWEDVRDGQLHDIIKNDEGLSGDNPPSSGGNGETWSSGPLSSDPDEAMYSVMGDVREADGGGLELAGGDETTIMKTNYEGGVVSVTIYMKCSMRNWATIRSVKIGGTVLLYEGEPTVEIKSGESTAIPYTFETEDGEPASGDMEIIVMGTGTDIYKAVVFGFTIN